MTDNISVGQIFPGIIREAQIVQLRDTMPFFGLIMIGKLVYRKPTIEDCAAIEQEIYSRFFPVVLN